MTYYVPRASAVAHTLALIFMAGMFSFLAACGGGDEAKGGASIANLTVIPEEGYPGVDVEVSFEIVPDSGRSAEDFTWRVDFGDSTSQSGATSEAQAIHRYNRSGRFTIRVEVLHNSSLAVAEEISYRVHDPIDLSVSSVTGQPNNLRVGETITVSSTVRNETAGDVVTAVPLRAYLSESPSVSREDLSSLPVIGNTVLSPDENGIVFAGGASRNVGLNAPVPTVNSGQYHVVVVIDPDNHIADTNPDDNIAVSANRVRIENLEEALPDIAVLDLEIAPERAFPELNRVTRAFKLTNLGNEDVFNVVYRTYLQVGSPVRDDSAQLLHTSSPINLSARQERRIGPDEFILSESIVPPSSEELEVYVIVEAFSEDGDIEEIRLDNNTAASGPIAVSDQPVDGPDIAVHYFRVSPESTYLDGSLQIEAVIANDGTADVSSFFCGIYMGPEPRLRLDGDPRLTNINIPALAAGAVREINRVITIPALYDPGVYYFYIVCDPNGALNEPFRGNNHLIQFDPITITDEADIDLYVESLTLPATAEDGDIIEVQARVCVNGTNSSGITTGHLYRSSGATVDYSATPYHVFELPNINPGECRDLTFDVEARCKDFDDRFNVGIYVDATQSLPEQNRTNNRRAANTPTQLSGLYCSCEEDDFAPNHRALDAYDLDDGAYSAAICEVGKCDFYAVDVSQGDSVIVTTTFDSSRGDLITTMLTPGGHQVLDRDTSKDFHQVGIFVSGDDLRYIFTVCPPEGTSVRNYYDFDVEILPQPTDVDVMPRNVKIPPQNTFSLGASMNVEFRVYNLGQEPTGTFSAKLLVTSDENVSSSDVVLGTYNIDNINGGAFRDVVISTSLPAVINDDDYFIAVVLDPDEVLNETRTENNVAFSRQFTVETFCYDAFTPNDSFSQAAPVQPATYSNLVACAGKSDYYEICAPNGHSVTAKVTFDSTQGDIDARLYNQNLEVIDTSAQSGVNTEEVNVEYVNGDQCYYLRVYLVSLDPDAQNTYQLQVEVDELPPELQCDPSFEPNDDFATATSLWAALQHPSVLNRCPKEDTDFFGVQLSPQSTVNFRAILDPPVQPGTLRLQLYRPNGTPDVFVETAPGISTAEIANYQPPISGRYHLQVTVGGDERRVTYRLEADGLPGVDLAVRDLSIGPGTYHYGDNIRYGFTLKNFGGDAVTSINYRVFVSDSPTLNVADAQLLGDFYAPDLGADDSVEIDGQVAMPANHGIGPHYLHIFVDPDDLLGDVNRNNNRANVSIIFVDPPDDDD